MKEPMTLCFTGHRPKYFRDWDWNNPWTNPAAQRMIQFGTRDLTKIMDQYPVRWVWSGGALGWDQIAFWIVYKMKLADPNLRLGNHIAVPYKEQAKGWRAGELVDRYNQMLKLADKVIYTDYQDGYADGPVLVHTNKKLDLRNRYMVDKSDIVYAMWNGSNGGTKNCIDYAVRNKKIIYVTNPETGEFYRHQ